MVEKLRPGPTRSVFFGHPSRGCLVGCWHAFRLTVGIAAHTCSRLAHTIAKRILIIPGYRFYSGSASLANLKLGWYLPYERVCPGTVAANYGLWHVAYDDHISGILVTLGRIYLRFADCRLMPPIAPDARPIKRGGGLYGETRGTWGRWAKIMHQSAGALRGIGKGFMFQ